MDRQTETGQNRNMGYENQLSVATISLRHLEVALCSTDMNCVGKGRCTSPVDAHKNLFCVYVDFCTCLHPLDYLFWDSQKHISVDTLCSRTRNTARLCGVMIFGKLRATQVGKSSGAEHTVRVRNRLHTFIHVNTPVLKNLISESRCFSQSTNRNSRLLLTGRQSVRQKDRQTD